MEKTTRRKRKMSLPPLVLLLVLGGPLNGGSAARAEGVKLRSETSEVVAPAQDIATILAQIKKPTTRIELLQNLRLIVSQRLLKYDGLYTAKNLEHIFGGERVDWAWVDKTVWITFENYVDFISPECKYKVQCYIGSTHWDFDHKGHWQGGSTINGVKLEFYRSRENTRMRDKTILRLFLPDEDGLSFESVKGIFAGGSFTLASLRLADNPIPASQPHGNEWLGATTDNAADSTLSVSILFSPSANLKFLEIHQEYR